MNHLLPLLLIGIGATAIMDVWGIIRRHWLGIAPPNYAMVGRWIGHMGQGRFYHNAIARSAAIRGEHIIGWAAHYLTGITFGGLLIGIYGDEWIQHPTIGPAVTVGLGTVAAPFLLMQPGMGLGIAASRAPNPSSARLQSLLTHLIFGLGLYLSGWIAKGLLNI